MASLLCSQYIGQGGFTGTRRGPEKIILVTPALFRTYGVTPAFSNQMLLAGKGVQIFRTEPAQQVAYLSLCSCHKKPETCKTQTSGCR